MSEIRRTFSRDFKIQVVKRILEEGQGIRASARDLGISKSSIARWVQAYQRDPEACFPGPGRPKSSAQDVAHLHRRIASLEQEVAFLKKAKAFFTQQKR